MGRIEINFFMLVEKIYVSFGIRSKHCPDQRIELANLGVENDSFKIKYSRIL